MRLTLHGLDDERTLISVTCLAISLIRGKKWAETKDLTHEALPAARRALGSDHELTIKLECQLARASYADEGASLDELRQAISMYEDLIRRARRIFGDSHPAAESMAARIEEARTTLARRTQS